MGPEPSAASLTAGQLEQKRALEQFVQDVNAIEETKGFTLKGVLGDPTVDCTTDRIKIARQATFTIQHGEGQDAHTGTIDLRIAHSDTETTWTSDEGTHYTHADLCTDTGLKTFFKDTIVVLIKREKAHIDQIQLETQRTAGGSLPTSR